MRIITANRLTRVLPLAVVLTQLMACTSSGGAHSDGLGSVTDQYEQRDRNRGQIYAGAGLGLSQLEPDTSERPGYDVSDSSGMSSQFTLGVDVSRRFSAELHMANLGSAEISPQGDLDYQIGGLSGLVYAGKNRDNRKRRGMTGFGRIGIGMLQNSVSGGLQYETVNSTHLLLGLGAEYNMRSGFGVRGELISYEEDANVLQLALIYRFNRKSREYVEPLVEATPEPMIVPLIAPVAAVAVVFDGDNDGIIVAHDRCPTTAPGVSVNSEGCALFAGVIEGVNFHSNSAELTDSAKLILNDVAITLGKFPAASVQVKAHTDSLGKDEYNLSLSEKRAASVSDYLSSRGVNPIRLAPSAYGETQPITTNDTAEGRRQNRRVELFAIDKLTE